jgi:hypothetical protein
VVFAEAIEGLSGATARDPSSHATRNAVSERLKAVCQNMSFPGGMK